MDAKEELAKKQGLPLEGKCACCGGEGTRHFPCLANIEEAVRMSYISCEPCFHATWAGEN
jgi:hypothetical protein